MMRILIAMSMFLYGQPVPFQATIPVTIEKNGMTVSWLLKPGAIKFTMEAPTEGWVMIGINSEDQLVGSLLYMGHMVDGKMEVVDHYVAGLGDYAPVVSMGIDTEVFDAEGSCEMGASRYNFCVMRKNDSEIHPDLIPGEVYTFHIAFSQSPDFQHHSAMRTKVRRKL